MDLYVLAADIRKRGVVAVWLCFEDQGTLTPVASLTEEASAETQSKFHRHVETRHAGEWVDLSSGNIVNSPVAIAYEVRDLADSDLGAVCRIQRTPRVVAG